MDAVAEGVALVVSGAVDSRVSLFGFGFRLRRAEEVIVDGGRTLYFVVIRV